ncbi:hypothetical protein ACXYTJ_01850 [Gilvimarinus sp. F26214L]|uniref:hypothetical protein n=1 Tax=Gilvimarinus sp. DZF01 TaxID=3461371 RepID=UPI004045D344
MMLEKVEPLVARFLAIDSADMPSHFHTANSSHLDQIVRIRQGFVHRTANEDRAYLRWRYRFDDDDTGLDFNDNRIWVFCKDQEILGFVGVESVRLLVNGGATKAIKVMDLVVRPELDRKGLGVWMNLKLQSMGLPIIALGSNRNSLGIMSKLFQRMPNQSVYKNILNSRRYFSSRIHNPLLAGALTSIYDLGYSLVLSGKALASRAKVEMAPVRRFSRADDASLAQMQHHGIEFQRTSDYLNWRFFDNPRDQIEVLGLRREGDLVGYIAVALRESRQHPGMKQAFLLDWQIQPGRAWEAALVAALIACQRRLRKEGFESISAFGYNEGSDRVLRRAGLHLRNDDTKTVSLFVRDPVTLKSLGRYEQWFITGADTDYA